MTVILASLAAFVSTSLGGLFALRFRDRLHLIMGFTAGVLLGLVAFELLPEIFESVEPAGVSPALPMMCLVMGFLVFHVAERLTSPHHGHEHGGLSMKRPRVGVMSALALSGHSFLDGVGIGLGFEVSLEVGVIVAVAVIAHDFCDGLNTVTLMLVSRNTRRRALVLLLIDALAPIAGVVLTFFLSIPHGLAPLYLGFFAGFLLYIGIGNVLPEAHRERSSMITVLLTVVGTVFAFAVTRFA